MRLKTITPHIWSKITYKPSNSYVSSSGIVASCGDVTPCDGGVSLKSCFQACKICLTPFSELGKSQGAATQKNSLQTRPDSPEPISQDHQLSSERKGNLIVCPLSRTSKLLVRFEVSIKIQPRGGGRARELDGFRLALFGIKHNFCSLLNQNTLVNIVVLVSFICNGFGRNVSNRASVFNLVWFAEVLQKTNDK